MVTELELYQFVDGNKMIVEHWRRVLPNDSQLVGAYEIIDGKCSCAGGQHGKECKHLRMLARTYFKDSIASWQIPFVAEALLAEGVVLRACAEMPATLQSVEIRMAGVTGLRVFVARCKDKDFVVYVEPKGP